MEIIKEFVKELRLRFSDSRRYSWREIAEKLNERGFSRANGKDFTAHSLLYFVQTHFPELIKQVNDARQWDKKFKRLDEMQRKIQDKRVQIMRAALEKYKKERKP